jgi:NitT/TauT family transport system permease protein
MTSSISTTEPLAEGAVHADAAAGRARGRFRDGTVRLGISLIPVVALIVLWALATEFWLTQSRIFPSPGDVATELGNLVKGEGPVNSSYADAAATMLRIAVAFLLSFALGAGLGILAGRRKLVFDVLSNPVWIFMAVPSVIWAFIFVVIFGTGDVVPIGALMALLVPKVLITVAEGTKAMPSDMLEMARSYRASRWRTLREVYVPQLVPYLVSSARVAFALAIKLAVVTEVIGLEKGIGYQLEYWYTAVVLAPVVAWGVVLICLGMAVDYLIFAPLERRAGRWRQGADTQTIDLGVV